MSYLPWEGRFLKLRRRRDFLENLAQGRFQTSRTQEGLWGHLCADMDAAVTLLSASREWARGAALRVAASASRNVADIAAGRRQHELGGRREAGLSLGACLAALACRVSLLLAVPLVARSRCRLFRGAR